jgi:hypothetical protein
MEQHFFKPHSTTHLAKHPYCRSPQHQWRVRASIAHAAAQRYPTAPMGQASMVRFNKHLS